MAKVALPTEVVEKETLSIITDESPCTSPAGHCFGNDGGSGVPQNLKVAAGRGGVLEAWTLDFAKEKVEDKELYIRCQYCQKYYYHGKKVEV